MTLLNRWAQSLDFLSLSVFIVCALALASRPDIQTVGLVALAVMLNIELVQMRSKAAHVVASRQQVEADKQLLLESINSAPLAFSIYGPDNQLIAWNSSYENFYPKTFARYYAGDKKQKPSYADISRELMPDTLTSTEAESFIAERIASLHTDHGMGVDREFPVCGWHRVTKYVTTNGAVAGFAVDINTQKAHEKTLVEEISRREKVEKTLRQLATTDSLTGALNHREFMSFVSGQLDAWRTDKTPFALLLLDIDWFKSINDRFGHQVGDTVIVGVAKAINSQSRNEVDRIGRIGGEEFGALLPGASIQDAMLCAERIREEIELLVFEASDNTLISVTVSVGVTVSSENNQRITTLIGEADRAMYVSKANGRNRVTVFANAMHPIVTEPVVKGEMSGPVKQSEADV